MNVRGGMQPTWRMAPGAEFGRAAAAVGEEWSCSGR